jgi:putative transposase
VIAFIGEHKDRRVAADHGGLRWGVEPICAVLSEHGVQVAPSTYYDQVRRRPSRRQLRDEQIAALIDLERTTSRFGRNLGARTMWLRLRSKGHDVARCTVERIMRLNGWEGARRGRPPRTTIPDQRAVRAGDLVKRHFDAVAPNRLWVADFTYCPTWSGMVYVAFVIDAFSRRIIGWRAATRMTTPLVLDALEHAVWTRARDGVNDLTGLVHHNDAGSQYTSIAFTDRLVAAGVDPSVGSVGDAYDNALAETTIGLFKTELIKTEGPWRDLDHVEAATLDWVHWYNTDRTHEAVDDLTPVAAEEHHYRYRANLEHAG